MNKDNEHTLVEIFAGKTIDAEIVKTLLQNAEIESYLKDELIGNLVPWNASAGGTAAVKIFISSDDYEKGREVVDDYYKNIHSD